MGDRGFSRLDSIPVKVYQFFSLFTDTHTPGVEKPRLPQWVLQKGAAGEHNSATTSLECLMQPSVHLWQKGCGGMVPLSPTHFVMVSLKEDQRLQLRLALVQQVQRLGGERRAAQA